MVPVLFHQAAGHSLQDDFEKRPASAQQRQTLVPLRRFSGLPVLREAGALYFPGTSLRNRLNGGLSGSIIRLVDTFRLDFGPALQRLLAVGVQFNPPVLATAFVRVVAGRRAVHTITHGP